MLRDTVQVINMTSPSVGGPTGPGPWDGPPPVIIPGTNPASTEGDEWDTPPVIVNL